MSDRRRSGRISERRLIRRGGIAPGKMKYQRRVVAGEGAGQVVNDRPAREAFNQE